MLVLNSRITVYAKILAVYVFLLDFFTIFVIILLIAWNNGLTVLYGGKIWKKIGRASCRERV